MLAVRWGCGFNMRVTALTPMPNQMSAPPSQPAKINDFSARRLTQRTMQSTKLGKETVRAASGQLGRRGDALIPIPRSVVQMP
jgi:hypothetical protein